MKKILRSLTAAIVIGVTSLVTSVTADAQWGRGGYRGLGFGGVAYRGYGYRGLAYRGYGYGGLGYRGLAYRGYGYGGLGYGAYGHRGIGYGYAGYGYALGTAIVVAPTLYYPTLSYGYSGCGC